MIPGGKGQYRPLAVPGNRRVRATGGSGEAGPQSCKPFPLRAGNRSVCICVHLIIQGSYRAVLFDLRRRFCAGDWYVLVLCSVLEYVPCSALDLPSSRPFQAYSLPNTSDVPVHGFAFRDSPASFTCRWLAHEAPDTVPPREGTDSSQVVPVLRQGQDGMQEIHMYPQHWHEQQGRGG
jgi:hypothetical protein